MVYPHISILTGIAYDHINVFPTFEGYVETFATFIETHEPDGIYFWYEKDTYLKQIAANTAVKNKTYSTPKYVVNKGQSAILLNGNEFQLSVVGEHNLENLEAASLVCEQLGISRKEFFIAAADFSGAGRRM